MQVAIQDQGTLPGIADVVVGLGPGEIDDSLLGAAAKAIEEAAIPLQETMGAWDRLSPLIEWCRERRLVRELPEAIVTLPWFACHVPHGGTSQISFEASQQHEFSVGLKVFGSGYERGRSFHLTVSEESDPRTACAIYYVDVWVLPKIYAVQENESIVIEVLGEAGTRSETMDSCPFCSVAPDALDPFDHTLDPYIDLRHDTVSHKRTLQLDWSETHTFEIGFTLPTIQLPLTLNVQASSPSTWKMIYEFQPGYFYQPYRRLAGPRYQPPMWAYSI
jgi:hypothetical protein